MMLVRELDPEEIESVYASVEKYDHDRGWHHDPVLLTRALFEAARIQQDIPPVEKK